MKGLQPQTVKNIGSVLELLRETPGGIHLRGICKALGLNPFTVSRVIGYLAPFVDVKEINEFGFRVSLVRFKAGKEGTTVVDVVRYHYVKGHIKG